MHSEEIVNGILAQDTLVALIWGTWIGHTPRTPLPKAFPSTLDYDYDL